MARIIKLSPSPTDTIVPINLFAQTGMPGLHQSRSRELSMSYDALIGNQHFRFNPFGPQLLRLSRSNHHW
jgi:hypothetical protein